MKTSHSQLLSIMGGLLLLLLASCRTDDEYIVPSTPADVERDSTLVGLYLLNEGNMGSNKCTLDWYDAATGVYHRNIFAERNPTQAQELGDVGNDLQQYGSRLYAVVNCSHLVEVMDINARHIGTISVPNCRYIAFHEGFAYVSSYAGPVQIDPNARLGYVAKVDTATLQIVGECTVGYQPEEMAVLDGKLYVANSGGYLIGRYDRTVSVIDLNTFTEERKIDVAINLHRIRADRHGQLWVTSRGDRKDIPSQLFCIKDGEVVYSFPHAVSGMDIVADTLHYFASGDEQAGTSATYGRLDIRTHQPITPQSSILNSQFSILKTPYGIKVNPTNGDIFLTDAGNYVTPGRLYCFDRNGHCKWDVTTGDIPAHICLIRDHVDAPASGTEEPRRRIVVDEYMPAPGQFVNTMPEATADDTPETMAAKCTETLASGGLVTLGAFGGYITFHFEQPLGFSNGNSPLSITNIPGQPDFVIKGNATASSAEPGIVMVSQDTNGNGQPDDEWYELSGSADIDSPEQVFFGYQIIYRRTPMQDIPWTDNRGGAGTIARNSYHTQEYFPLWIKDDALSFTGTRLPNNAEDTNGNGSNWVLSPFRYGYVDNLPNSNTEGNSFDLDWAVDKDRQRVHLTHADFIRVYSAMNQQCGWLGETSTEIAF